MSQLKPLPTSAPGWERIHFHFFADDELGHLRAHWKHLAICKDRPACVEVPGGTLPKLALSAKQPRNRLVCVYDRDYRPVEASVRIRESGRDGIRELRSADFSGAHRDNRSAYFLGVNARHYGHFLLETLCRAWAWTEQDNRVAVVASGPVRDFAREFCELIPGLANRIEVLEVSTQFDSVTVPAPSFVIGRQAHAEFKTMCERMTERAVRGPSHSTEQPVYVSRAGLYSTAKRFLVGESRLEAFLESEGFRIVRPESLPAAEQIALFDRHKWVVTPIGSACHSRLFSRRPINFVVLCQRLVGMANRPSNKSSFILCDLLGEGSTHYASVLATPDVGTGMNLEASFPVMLDEARLLTLLKELGLIRANAAPKGPAPDLAEYKRKWIEFAKLTAEKRGNRRLSQAIAALEAGLGS